jgi:hypothetical protein
MNEIPRLLDALEVIASELEQLRILKEHELGVRLERSEHGPPTCLRVLTRSKITDQGRGILSGAPAFCWQTAGSRRR